jgi:thiosulfate/3-mercaptopyruvate sulfurtransferase
MTDLLVSADWLEGNLDDVVVADVRWDIEEGLAGAERAFEQGHIPGAIFFDVERDLAARAFDGPGRHPLPSPEAFAATLARAGIAVDDLVVIYDEHGGTYAARLWWMLDATGRTAALLDGGLGGWGGPLETGPQTPRPPSNVERVPWPADRMADADEVARALADASATVIDVRAPERFRGDVEPFDPVAGHIPGAVNAPLAGNLDETTARFLAAEQLRDRYASYGRAIAHCGSGVTACHAVFAMRLAGLEQPKLYVGSWSDWVHDPKRPVATGDDG